jgi:iron complex outermembrane receptor protein
MTPKYRDLLLTGLLFISSAINGFTQPLNDTLALPEFEVRSNYVVDNLGFKRTRLDSSLLAPSLNADLSTILSQHTTIFIKSYGNGTLSTPSFRGTTSQHTQVEWNGINLGNPMLGQVDLSQIPVSQFDGLEILYGASGISRTSGAFGGVINLVSKPDWNNRLYLSAGQTLASFDTYTTSAGIVLGNNNIQTSTKFNYTSSLNNFPFYNEYTRSFENQQNASYKLYGISEELFIKLKDRHLLSGKIWYSYNDRNLPPTTSTINPLKVEKLKDQSLRAILEYKYIEKKYNLLVRSALIDQFSSYLNDTMQADNQCYSSINRVRFNYSGVRNMVINTGIDFTYDWVISDNYDGLKQRATSGFFAEINVEFSKKFSSSLVMREDIVDGEWMPFIPALGLEFRPFSDINLSFALNLSRNFRYPTLNELYWDQFGNPDLLPETDYSAELGSTYNVSTNNKKVFLEATISGYYNMIYDLIEWSPEEGNASIWKPSNVREVLARGLEAGLNLKLDILGFRIGLDNNYNYSRSTYQKTTSPNDNSLGKQLIYIPVNTFNSNLSLQRWKFYLMYNFSFIGERFSARDNLNVMPAYYLSNLIFGKNLVLKNIVLSLQLQINNLFNVDYQSVASRPMPGINYAVTVKFSFNKGIR